MAGNHLLNYTELYNAVTCIPTRISQMVHNMDLPKLCSNDMRNKDLYENNC